MTVLTKSLLAIRDAGTQTEDWDKVIDRVPEIYGYSFSYGMGGYEHSVLSDRPPHEQPPAQL